MSPAPRKEEKKKGCDSNCQSATITGPVAAADLYRSHLHQGCAQPTHSHHRGDEACRITHTPASQLRLSPVVWSEWACVRK